jgi:hypothetical protein
VLEFALVAENKANIQQQIVNSYVQVEEEKGRMTKKWGRRRIYGGKKKVAEGKKIWKGRKSEGLQSVREKDRRRGREEGRRVANGRGRQENGWEKYGGSEGQGQAKGNGG